jgi:hypothetical protein
MSKPKRYRGDGWPICPVCDEDELAQLTMFEDWPQDEEQRLLRLLSSSLFCYVCARTTVEKGEAI